MSALQQQGIDGSQMIYRLIPEVMKEIGHVEKNRKNEQQKYSFRGIEDFYQAAHPAFVKYGIFCAPEVLDREATSFEKVNDFGKVTTWRHVTLRVRHRFYAGDGSYVDVTTFGEGLDNSDKASNKAMSGAMKYALIELFSVPTQDIEDADKTSPETGQPAKPVAVVTQPKTFTKPAAAPPPPERQPGEDDEESLAPLAEKLIETIDGGRQANFARAFRMALPKKYQNDADAERLRHDWLGMNAYVDDKGNPTSKAIELAEFEQVKKEACEWARSAK